MSHRTLTTAANVVVNHSHPDQAWEYSDADKAAYQAATLAGYPGIQPVQYVRLTHVPQELGPTKRYNCWGFTFNPRQCWLSSGTDVQNILNGNGTQVYAPNLRLGDVICYRGDASGGITHTGRIWSLDAAGQPALIQSKWGGLGEYLHQPLVVPAIYGTNVTYWRVAPLTGKGDAWHQDNASDDRLAFPPGICWLSPDVWCNNGGGTTHEDPVRGSANQLYARLHNPDTLAVNGIVRFYWADPNGGIPHTDWNSIGTAPVNAAPGGTVIVGPVAWTPGATVPDHTCLLAIADIGDDPFAAATTDPIVWPFDVCRDNNIVQRNVGVVTLTPKPGAPPLPFTAGNPFPFPAKIQVVAQLSPLVRADVKLLGVDPRVFGPVIENLPEKPPRQRRVNLRVDIKSDGVPWRGADVLTNKATLSLDRVPPGRIERLTLKPTMLKIGAALEAYRLDLTQRVGGVMTGGMTYVLILKRR